MKSLKVKCDVINPKFNYKFWKAFQQLQKEEKKKYMAVMSDAEKISLKKYLYKYLGCMKSDGDGLLEECMLTRNLNTFNAVDFVPFLKRKGDPKINDGFNTFTGFPFERVNDFEPVDFTKSRLYKHIKEEMLDNNEGEFNHFLDHIADMIQDPMNIKTNGHLFYTKQGMGKGMLAEFVSKLLGTDHTISFENTDAYFGKFNSDQSNKILKIFEEVSNKGVAFQNHDRLKGDQSKKSERIEPKGIDPYNIRHCARFWYFTNNENALFIEGGDRRFTCHKANNRYANNYEYFAGIWAEVNDTNFCKNAFEYFATREYDVKNAYLCYENKFKTEQKQLNLPNGLKYLKEIAEEGFKGLEMDDDKIKAKTLSESYKEWCSDNGVKFSLGALKTQLKKLDIVDKSIRFNGVKAKCYVLDDLENKYAEFLKDADFKFDMVDDDDDE